jgi:hypothetical protein
MRATINQWIQQNIGYMNLSNKQINPMGVTLFIKHNWHNVTAINFGSSFII